MKRTADKYDLRKHIELNTSVLETIWDEGSGKWKIKLEHSGQVKEDEADFLINCSGFLKYTVPSSFMTLLTMFKQVEVAGYFRPSQLQGKAPTQRAMVHLVSPPRRI